MLSFDRVLGRPWAIRGEIADHVQRLLRARGFGGLRELAQLRADVVGRPDIEAARGGGRTGGGAVAVIPAIGVLTQRGGVIDCMETRSTAQLVAEVRAMVAEPTVDGIVLEFDSPGGEVFGVPEAAAAIRDLAAVKPIVAHANSVAASAAYWLASACSELWVTPSGEVGSIGVYCAHVDESKALEAEGIVVTLISAGKYKVEGNPLEPLGDEARAAMQLPVDLFYSMFTRDVAKGRGVSPKKVQGGFGEGRMVAAAAAVEQGMADKVGTLEDAIRRASSLGRSSRSAPAAVRGSLPSWVPEAVRDETFIRVEERPDGTAVALSADGTVLATSTEAWSQRTRDASPEEPEPAAPDVLAAAYLDLAADLEARIRSRR